MIIHIMGDCDVIVIVMWCDVMWCDDDDDDDDDGEE